MKHTCAQWRGGGVCVQACSWHVQMPHVPAGTVRPPGYPLCKPYGGVCSIRSPFDLGHLPVNKVFGVCVCI